MAQISSFGALPDPSAYLSGAASKPSRVDKGADANKTIATSPSATDQTQASPLQSQLTRLSAVLNGLQSHAATTRTQYVQTLNKVKSGTYQVNASEVSRSIVSDLLTQRN